MPATAKHLPRTPSQLPAAYSYIRFSTPKQAEGDSLRRQTEATAKWCARNGFILDTSLTLTNLGVSGFKGAHRTDDKHALAQFLHLAKQGRIPKGSYLVIENLDRLSREDERTALRLWMDILDQGINIVQLSPETVFRHEKPDMTDIIRAIIELSRGHSESREKSRRVAAAWVAMRKKARENGGVVTRRLPAWVEERDGELAPIPERAAVVKHIFNLAAAGYGWMGIVKRLKGEGVPAFGTVGFWTRSYVAMILKDRRAVGEYQPYCKGVPEGEPIKGYYPAVVTEEEWLAANAGITQRRRRQGGSDRRWTEEEDVLVRNKALTATEVAKRTGRTRPAVLQRRSFLLRETKGREEKVRRHSVNLFTGLIRNARNGQPYYSAIRVQGKQPWHVLIDKEAVEGRGPAYSFPLLSFETAILKCLREVDPREVAGGDDGPNQVMVLEGEKARARAKIEEIEAELLNGNVSALAKVLRRLEEEEREIDRRLAEARRKAATPLSDAWGEAKSLLGVLDAAPDPEDARLRLRSALRRTIDEIWMLVTNRGRDRLAAVQVWFQGGEKFRNYWILHRPAKANRSGRTPGRVWVDSMRYYNSPGVIDIRKKEDAEYELERLLHWDPEHGEPYRSTQVGTIE